MSIFVTYRYSKCFKVHVFKYLYEFNLVINTGLNLTFQSTEWSLNGDLIATEINLTRHQSPLSYHTVSWGISHTKMPILLNAVQIYGKYLSRPTAI